MSILLQPPSSSSLSSTAPSSSSPLTTDGWWAVYQKTALMKEATKTYSERIFNVISLERTETSPSALETSSSSPPSSSSNSSSTPGVLNSFITKNGQRNNIGVERLALHYGGVSRGVGGGEGVAVEDVGRGRENSIMGYAKKGLHEAKSGVAAIVGRAQNLINITTKESAGSDDVSSKFVFNHQKFLLFGVTAAVGCIFMLMAFTLLPALVFDSSKFALFYTLGSMSWILSLGFLGGFKTPLQHLLVNERLPLTIAYLLSLALTLYSALLKKSYFFTVLFSTTQIFIVFAFLISYIPGGKSALQNLGASVCRMIKNAIKCPADSELPK